MCTHPVYAGLRLNSTHRIILKKEKYCVMSENIEKDMLECSDGL